MMKQILTWLLTITTLLCILVSPASIAQQEHSLISKHPVKEWNADLNDIEKNIESENLTINNLKNMLDKLITYQDMAEDCIDNTNAEITRINKALEISNSTNNIDAAATQSTAGKYTAKLKSELENLQKECRLFLLHSNDTASKLKNLQDQMTASRLFSRSTSVIDEIVNLANLRITENIEWISTLKPVEIKPFKNVWLRYIFVLLLIASFFIAYLIKSYCKNLLNVYSKYEVKIDILSTLKKYSYFLTVSFMLSIFFLASNIGEEGFNYYTKVSIVTFAYILFCAIINFIFYPPRPAHALVTLPGTIPRIFNKRVIYLNTLIYFSAIIYFTFNQYAFPSVIVDISVTLFLTLISISLMSIIWVVTRIPKLFYDWRFIKIFLNIVFTLFLLVTILTEWAGYHNIAYFLIQNLASTIFVLFSSWTVHILICRATTMLESNLFIRQQLGLRLNNYLYEIYIIKWTLLTVLWTTSSLIMLNLWVFSEVYFDKMQEALVDGFNLLSFSIAPGRIVIAILIFCILSLCSRWIQTIVSKSSRDYIEEGAQVAIGTITGYIGFVVALLIALIIAGVNFTGLAIIAGALSVGIGFGLQNIANDFISGLILLVETPIKPGDRITVGEIEGYVRRIRLRATQITTLHQSDIFIPNSQMISDDVVNYMFRNQRWRVVVNVGVAYGSDVELVKDLLMEVARSNPDVDQKRLGDSSVLFKKFDDSSLLFELRCVITNVNKKFKVGSDLHFAIDKIFKENNITIPFPQRDLHVKSWAKKDDE